MIRYSDSHYIDVDVEIDVSDLTDDEISEVLQEAEDRGLINERPERTRREHVEEAFHELRGGRAESALRSLEFALFPDEFEFTYEALKALQNNRPADALAWIDKALFPVNVPEKFREKAS